MGAPYGWYDGWYAPPAAARPARKARVAPTRKDKAEPNKKDAGFGQMPKGPLQIVVSIGTQKVTLFSNGVRVAQGPVSTGVPGRPTPTGVFSIIEKDRYHHSNLYSNAPMPYMQRITWSGVALHEGVLPGYPASHGCIRMSHDFAQKLWPHHQPRRTSHRRSPRARPGRIRASQAVRAEAETARARNRDGRKDRRARCRAGNRAGAGDNPGRGNRCDRRGAAS